MTDVFSAATRYLSIILICIYMIIAFLSMGNISKAGKRKLFYYEGIIISVIYMMYTITTWLKTKSINALVLCLVSYIVMLVIVFIYCKIYPKSNKFLLMNIWLMFSIGSLILLRISYTKALRQFVMGAVTLVITLIVPYIISKVKFFRNYYYSYAAFGILLLLIVLVIGNVTYGAKLSLSFGFISVQPSEFIKITYPMFIAGMLYRRADIKNVVITSVLCGVHIIILVLSKDLGSALIFSVAYLFMVYVATGKKIILPAGLLAGCVAAGIAYLLFSHVQVRVAAWLNPWDIIDNNGYQIAQSIFAIGTGSLFGMGLYDGNPNYIPVVEQDFIFSAISEEMGGFFALALLLLCFHTFVIMIRIAFKCSDHFYKLTCFGMAVIYGIQVFLTVGGAVKLIPSTGVTLPLISYGGSSLVSTLLMFAIIQGFNIYDGKEIKENTGETGKISGTEKKQYKKTE